MRPALAVLIWVILIGGLSAYMHYREGSQPLVAYRFHEAEGVYSLEVVATFAMEPDPFALAVGDSQPAALLIRLNGKEVVRQTDRLEPGLPLQVPRVAGMVEGRERILPRSQPSCRTLASVQCYSGTSPEGRSGAGKTFLMVRAGRTHCRHLSIGGDGRAWEGARSWPLTPVLCRQ